LGKDAPPSVHRNAIGLGDTRIAAERGSGGE
jgi:hypothetical protein